MTGPREQQVDRFRAAVRMIGDRWSLLVLYTCLGGVTRFEEIQRTLGIARSVLSHRLGRLTDLGLLERRPVSREARRSQYLPTEAAKMLRPVLHAMIEWHGRHRPARQRNRQPHEEGLRDARR